MSALTEKSKIVRQNTSNSKTGVLAIANDISRILVQLNEVLYPLVATLPSTGRGHDIDALDVGLGGTRLFTDPSATAGAGDLLYAAGAARPATLQESLSELQSQIITLKNQVDLMNDIMEYDDTEIVAAVEELELKIGQVAEDAYGSSYVLNADGSANLTHSLSKIIDNLGTFFSDYEGTDQTHEGTYPTLGLIVDGLEDLKAFSGFLGSPTTDYTAEGGPYLIDDKTPLMDAIVEMDNKIYQLAGSEFIYPDRFKNGPSSGGSTGTRSWFPVTSSSETTLLQGVSLSNSVGEQELNLSIVHPVDRRGRAAVAFKVSVFLFTTTSPSSGTDVAIEIKGRTYAGVGPGVLNNGTAIGSTFKVLETLNATMAVSEMKIVETSEILLEDTNYGIIPLKIVRTPMTGLDDFDGDIQVFGVKIDWFHNE